MSKKPSFKTKESKKPSFKTKDCYTHGNSVPRDICVKGELRSGTEGATQLTTQNHLQYDRRQTDPYLKLELQHKKGSIGTILMWKCIETRGRATKVPNDH